MPPPPPLNGDLLMRTALSTSLLVLLAGTSAAQVHVDDDAAPGGDGTSWATAYSDLDVALRNAPHDSQVWVAEGRYIPTRERVQGDPRSVSFSPPSGVDMYGGFLGFEASLASRAGNPFKTILDGSIGVVADETDNAYHVVYLDLDAARREVDGFHIRKGFADGAGRDASGGGLYTLGPFNWVTNCIFQHNHSSSTGGALRGAVTTRALINGCTFRRNSTDGNGGALVSQRSYHVTNTTFFGNSAANAGGAVYAIQGTRSDTGVIASRYQNCVFQNNRANNGGAVFLRGRGTGFSGPKGGMIDFSGCTFAQNVAIQNGAAIGMPTVLSGGLNGCAINLTNSIVWGNMSRGLTMLSGASAYYPVVEYSIVEGGWPGIGNLNQDPLFVSAPRSLLRLRAGSPAIDAGSNGGIGEDDHDLNGNMSVIDPTPYDFDGAARRRDDPATPDTGAGGSPVVDMGAFEF